MLRNDPLAALILDPVITVHPDQVIFEVFSKDESTYAYLAFDRDALRRRPATPAYGTTNIDFSQALFDGVQQMRGYRETRLHVGRDGVEGRHRPAARRRCSRRRSRSPTRGSAGSSRCSRPRRCRSTTFRLAPMDLYNVLRHLRMNGDRKGKRRGLRFELVPGEQPRLVLEPWETVLTATGERVHGQGGPASSASGAAAG